MTKHNKTAGDILSSLYNKRMTVSFSPYCENVPCCHVSILIPLTKEMPIYQNFILRAQKDTNQICEIKQHTSEQSLYPREVTWQIRKHFKVSENTTIRICEIDL